MCATSGLPRPALLALSAALFASPLGALAQNPPLYTVTIAVVDEASGKPIERAVVRMEGEGIRFLEYPASYQVAHLTGTGVKTDATGLVKVVLQPGRYRVNVTHDSYQTGRRSFVTLTVPDPLLPDETEFEFRVPLKFRPELDERCIVVEISKKRLDALDREVVKPFGLGEASAEVRNEAGWLLLGVPTDAKGVAVIKSSDLVPGDTITVRAVAKGFRPQETRFIVGSRQGGPTPYFLAPLTTKWDRVEFALEPDPGEAKVELIVEVCDKESGQAVEGAFVEVRTVGGDLVEVGNTGADGKTAPLGIPVGANGAVRGELRVKVSHPPRHDDAWSDIPQELLAPSPDPRLYVVSLAPATNGSQDLKGCQQEASEAYERFAKARGAEPYHYTADIVRPLVWLAKPPLADPGQVLWVDVNIVPQQDDKACQEYLEGQKALQDAQSFTVAGHKVVYVPVTMHWVQRHCTWTLIFATALPAPSVQQRLNIVREVIAAVGECGGAPAGR